MYVMGLQREEMIFLRPPVGNHPTGHVNPDPRPLAHGPRTPYGQTQRPPHTRPPCPTDACHSCLRRAPAAGLIVKPQVEPQRTRCWDPRPDSIHKGLLP